MDVLEICAKMIRDAVGTMSTKFSAHVKDEINTKVSSLYKPGGAATLATLPALTADNSGYVYDMTEGFTTTANFREGAGHKYPAGTNVVVSDVGNGVYKYDVLSGMLDGYVQESRKIGNVPLSADIPVTLTGDTAITVTNTGTASAIGYSVAHNDSGVTAGSKGDTTNQTPGFGETFKTLSVTVDTKGHVTNISEHSVQIPDTEATQSAKGLMSPADKTKLDTLIDSTLSNTGKAADAKATGDAIAALRDYLKSMEIYRKASGNPSTFSDGAAANVKALSVEITSTQSGSGDPSPTNVRPISGATSVSVMRTGKNLFKITGNTTTINAITFTVNHDSGTVNVNGNPSSNVTWYSLGTISLLPGDYILTGGASDRCLLQIEFGDMTIRNDNVGGTVFTVHTAITKPVYIRAQSNQNNVTVYPMIRYASDADATFMPYADAQSVMVSLVDSNSDPLTVYGGTLNVTTGELTVTWGNLASYNGETLPGVWISDRDVYAPGATPTSGAQVVYELAAPVTYQLTPAQIATLSGYNTVSTDAGTLSVTYRADPSITLGGG